MIALRFRQRAIVLAVVIAIAFFAAHVVISEPKDNSMTTIRAEDIPKTVQIIGRLGQPLGDLVTVRGRWVRPGIRSKDRSLFFEITIVNGISKKSLELRGSRVSAILPHQKGRKPKPGETWDWKFEWGGKVSPPSPAEGETWEMLGVETGCFDSYSKAAWREIGSPTVQLQFRDDFYSRFEFIAVRKIK